MESDSKLRAKDVETLRKENRELQEQVDNNIMETTTLERHLKKAEADVRAIEEIKDQELQVYIDDFE